MTPLPQVLDVARDIKREVERTQLRARKGIALVARRPPLRISLTPKDEVWSLGKATLWRYRSDRVSQRPPVMLFLGLVGDSAIFDLHPGNSWAEALVGEGFDVFLFDWGQPGRRRGRPQVSTPTSSATSSRPWTRYVVSRKQMRSRWAPTAWVRSWRCCCWAATRPSRRGNLVLFTPPCDHEHSPRFIQAFRDGRISPFDAIDETTGLVPGGRGSLHVPVASTNLRPGAVRDAVGEPVAGGLRRVASGGEPLGLEPSLDGRSGLHRDGPPVRAWTTP